MKPSTTLLYLLLSLCIASCSSGSCNEHPVQNEPTKFGLETGYGVKKPGGVHFHDATHTITFTWPAFTVDRGKITGYMVFVWKGRHSGQNTYERANALFSFEAPAGTGEQITIKKSSDNFEYNQWYVWQVMALAVSDDGKTQETAVESFMEFENHNIEPRYDGNAQVSPPDHSLHNPTTVTLDWPDWTDMDGDKIDAYDVYLQEAGGTPVLIKSKIEQTVAPNVSVNSKSWYAWWVVAFDQHGLETVQYPAYGFQTN